MNTVEKCVNIDSVFPNLLAHFSFFSSLSSERADYQHYRYTMKFEGEAVT